MPLNLPQTRLKMYPFRYSGQSLNTTVILTPTLSTQHIMFRSSSNKDSRPSGPGVMASAASAIGLSSPPPLPKARGSARSSIMEKTHHGEESLDEVKKEVNRANAGMAVDEDAKVSMSETVLYQVRLSRL